jgi:hypothetical protein
LGLCFAALKTSRLPVLATGFAFGCQIRQLAESAVALRQKHHCFQCLVFRLTAAPTVYGGTSRQKKTGLPMQDPLDVFTS